MNPQHKENKKRNSKGNKENRLNAEEATGLNNFNSTIVEGVLIGLLVYLIDNGTHKIKSSRLHSKKRDNVEVQREGFLIHIVEDEVKHQPKRVISELDDTNAHSCQRNLSTCRYLLTAKMYGKVAWAETGTDALLKP